MGLIAEVACWRSSNPQCRDCSRCWPALVGYFLWILYCRVVLEVLAAVFRMAHARRVIYSSSLSRISSSGTELLESRKWALSFFTSLEDAGAESIDRAREMWWVGLRDAAKETYQAQGGNFDEDERYFRCGFEAAQHSANRGKSYEDCRTRLGDLYPGTHEREPFRRGYKRGRAYFEALRKSAATPKC